jgi:sulfatase maturation enzyme AslB (radical SAM superfamily)
MTLKEFASKHHDVRVSQQHAPSIEQGHFVLTMMPSLFCELDCPHCYLSKIERRDPTRLMNSSIRKVLKNVDDFYDQRNIKRKTIHAYQYGGEPTSMGVDAFTTMLDTIEEALPKHKGYEVRHTILTSLVEVDLIEWLPVFRDRCGGFLQTSFDGRMRGGRYIKKWDDQMRKARDLGLTLSTISVVNTRILQDGPVETMEYLSELGVVEASFLPFMWNEQNDGKKYDALAPSMADWSKFMIDLTEAWIKRKSAGLHAPEIGQLRYILAQQEMSSPVSNIAGQTLFLMPNGDWALPDYKNGWQEFMNRFGNGLSSDFSDILTSPKRRAYIRRQMTRNQNSECVTCPHSDKCVMEFWKENRPDDDCFGGRRYIEWVLENLDRILAVDKGKIRTSSLY